MVHDVFVTAFIKECIDKGVEADSIVDEVRESEEWGSAFVTDVKNALQEGNHGREIISDRYYFRYVDRWEEYGLTVSQMYEELKEERDDILNKANKSTYKRIEEYINLREECPQCENELFYDKTNEEKYCPVCI